MRSAFSLGGRGLLLSLALGEILLALVAARNLDRDTLPVYLACYFGMAVFWIVASAVVLQEEAARRGDPILVLLVAAALRAVFLPSEPVLSDDVYRYVWDGRVQHEGINPYLYAPKNPELAFLREELPAIYPGINNKEIPTIYPPLMQTAFFLATAVSSTVFGMKAFFVLLDLALVYALSRLEPKRALIYAWSPLPVVEVGASGHNEPFAVFFLVAAFLAFAKRREVTSMLLLAASGMAKLASFALAPAFARLARPRALAMIPVAMAALALPYASAGGLAFRGLGEYAARWRSNDGLFHLLVVLTGSLERAKAAALLLFASVILLLVWKRVPPLRAGFLTLGALVLLSPVVHPWYLLWIAPFLVFFPHPAWLYLQAGVALSYHALYLASPGEPWQELAWVKLLEYAPFFFLLALHAAVRRPDGRSNAVP